MKYKKYILLILLILLILYISIKKEYYLPEKGDLILSGNGNFYYTNQPISYNCYLSTDNGSSLSDLKLNIYKNGNIVNYTIYDNDKSFGSGIDYITIQPIIDGIPKLFDMIPENDLFLGIQRLSLTNNPSFNDQLCKVYIGGKNSKNNISGKIIITKTDGSPFNFDMFYLNSMTFSFPI
jgi:hypothetical protein